MASFRERFRSPIRILAVVALVVACLLAPFVWNGIRERHRRAETARKLKEFGDALKLPTVKERAE